MSAVPERVARAVPVLVIAAASVLLLRFAASFDFFCDDAYIALRYARNWVELGEPVYNPNERVEGFTSFLATALTALQYRLGVDPRTGARILGGFGSVTTLAATWLLVRGLGRRTTVAAGFAVLGLALSAPVAAWTFGGLETTFFAGLSTLGVALAVRLLRGSATLRAAVVVGVAFALATLARPEGALFGGLTGLVLLPWLGRTRAGRLRLLALAGAYVAVVVPFVAWRWSFYGYPLPNTFYVKSTGGAAELLARGANYAALALVELGAPFVVLGAGLLFAPAALRGAGHVVGEEADEPAMRKATLAIGRLLVVTLVAYVIRVGGDFLDLYRFFVPLLPFIFVGLARGLLLLEAAVEARGRTSPVARTALVAAVAAGVLGLHGFVQASLARRAMAVAEAERARRNLEPLGWTKEYAERWTAMGKWIRDHAEPGDTMAAGAAGAMPYWAGIPSLDLFGLCDEYVAHHGDVVGTRPGHQRFAPIDYILKRRPTFLLLSSEDITREPGHLGSDGFWNAQGWVWAEAVMDASRYELPRRLYMRFLLRRERAEALRGQPEVRVAL